MPWATSLEKIKSMALIVQATIKEEVEDSSLTSPQELYPLLIYPNSFN